MLVGDMFKLRDKAEGVITGVFPLGQTTQITMKNGAYQVSVNGYKGHISTELFDALFVKEAPVIEEVVPAPKKQPKKAVK